MKCYRTKLSLENRLPSNDMKSIIIFFNQKKYPFIFFLFFFYIYVLTVFCYKKQPRRPANFGEHMV